MSKPGPLALSEIIIQTFDLIASPRPLDAVVARLALENAWFDNLDESLELTLAWLPKVRKYLERELARGDSLARPSRFDFNSISDYLIQGSSHVEANDAPDVKLAKRRRSHSALYQDYLIGVTPRDFEAVCRGIVRVLGCTRSQVTSYSKDQGIDFYGLLELEGKLDNLSSLAGVDRRLKMWIVGQAKQYAITQVSTPDLRELVGSVQLARTKTYVGQTDALAMLEISPLDPVLYLFITTGTISRDGWALIEKSGMVGMDGPMVVSFLADNGIGMLDEKFDEGSLAAWIQMNLLGE